MQGVVERQSHFSSSYSSSFHFLSVYLFFILNIGLCIYRCFTMISLHTFQIPKKTTMTKIEKKNEKKYVYRSPTTHFILGIDTSITVPA